MKYWNHKFSGLFFVIFITICCTSPKGEVQSAISKLNGDHILSSELDSFLLLKMDSLSIKGISIAIIDSGEVVYNKEFGVKNQYSQKPIDAITLFEAASLSKPLFAFFSLKLIQDGKMELDTPLYKYFPYPDIENDDRYKSITSRMVLSHTTGFPNWRWQNENQQLDIKFQPGTQFSYSGEAYEYLKATIAEVNEISPTGLDSLFTKEVIEPLGLSHLYYEFTPYVVENMASGHENDKVVYDSWMDRNSMQAAGGLYTNSKSYASFLISLMNEKLLNEKSVDELLKQQINVPDDDNLAKSGVSGYALGFGIKPSKYGDFYVHGGNNWGYTSGFVINLKSKYGFVFFTNSNQINDLAPDLEAFLMTDE